MKLALAGLLLLACASVQAKNDLLGEHADTTRWSRLPASPECCSAQRRLPPPL